MLSKLGVSHRARLIFYARAEVYVKKESTAKSSNGTSEKKEKKMSKADALAMLKTEIVEVGSDIDEDILGKITGKAAEYFAGVIKTARGN